jgi:hypothetical protein
MFRTARLSAVIVPLLALGASLTLSPSRAEAQVKPLKITGGGSAPDGIALTPDTPAPHSATGNATELGKYTGEGFFQILDYKSQLTAEFSSAPNFVFVAANGDHLAMTYGVKPTGRSNQARSRWCPTAMAVSPRILSPNSIPTFRTAPAGSPS